MMVKEVLDEDQKLNFWGLSLSRQDKHLDRQEAIEKEVLIMEKSKLWSFIDLNELA